MGPVNKPIRKSSDSKKHFPSKVSPIKKARPSEEPKKKTLSPTEQVLKQLGEVLDRFHLDPSSLDRKKLEEVLGTFFQEFKKTLTDLDLMKLMQQGINEIPKHSGAPVKIYNWFRKLMQSEEVDDYGCDRAFEEAIKPFFDFLFSKYWRVDVEGMENVPGTGRTLLVSNHSGVLPYDGAMIKVAIFNQHPSQREVRFLVDDFVFHFPFLGIFMNRIGGVRACPENAERLLNHEELVVVFPEGLKGVAKNFKERYQLQRFGRGGVIRIAMKTKSPITPVAVIGAEEIHPVIYKSSILARPLGVPFIPITPFFPLLGPLGMIPLPTKWKIIFGKQMPYDQFSPADVSDGILINSETEKLRSTIQAMVTKEVEARKSVFFSE